MRMIWTTGTAVAALSMALQGCATAEMPEPVTSVPPATEMADMAPGAYAGPSDLDGALLQAQMLRRVGDYDGATRTLGQLVLIAPDDARVLGEYGKTLVAKGDRTRPLCDPSRAGT